MPLSGPIHIPPIGEQTDPDKVRVAAVIGGQLASAPARGFGLTADELTALQELTALASFGAGVMIMTVATTSGTYTKPAGLRYLEVWCVGAGGGGSRAGVTGATTASASGGGGGGATCYRLYAAAGLAATQAYTIGAGGTGGGSPGTAGGNSVFAGMTAGGGGGGGALMGAIGTFNLSQRGLGGSATGGMINIDGQSGEQGVVNFGAGSGNALNGGSGGSFFAPSCPGIYIGAAQGGAPSPTGIGSGSSGGANGANQAAATSTASGAAGAIIFKEYF